MRPDKLARFAVFVWAFLLGATPSHADTQYVIVGSEPVSADFPSGKVLAPGDVLAIPEGTTVTLLGEDGSVTAIPGPAEVAVTADAVTTGEDGEATPEGNRSTLSKIAGLLAGERERAESLGVSRGFGDKPRPEGLDDPWAISVHDSAPACIRDGELLLARKEKANAIRLVFRIDEGEAGAALVWPSGEAKFLLERRLTAADRQLVVEAGKDFAKVELHHLPAGIDPENPMAVLGWMVDTGCNRQAVAFARALGREAQEN